MRRMFRKDTAIKILSVLSAALLWLYVLNIENPTDTRLISNIKVSKVNMNSLEDYGLIIKDDRNYYVSVTIEGKTRQIDRVSKSDFEVEADFSKVNGPGVTVVPIEVPKYTGPYNITIKKYEPDTIQVETDASF